MKALKSYNKPTPKLWRRIGDSLLAVSTMATTYAIATDNQTIAIIVLILGAVGKFLTNFFAVDDMNSLTKKWVKEITEETIVEATRESELLVFKNPPPPPESQAFMDDLSSNPEYGLNAQGQWVKIERDEKS